MQELDVFVNDPFDASILNQLFLSREDLLMASPQSAWPFSEHEWSALFARNQDGCSLLFYLEGKVIGHAALMINPEAELYLCYVILHPDYRGKNFADQMVNLTEEFCRLNYPHEELHLNVHKQNARAMKVYERLGYVQYKEEEHKFKMKKAL